MRGNKTQRVSGRFVALFLLCILLAGFAAGAPVLAAEATPPQSAAGAAAEAVQLSETAVTLKPGARGRLKAQVFPAGASQKVLWKSNRPAVAQVDAYGRVRALAPGRATLTATTQDGARRARCTVYVGEPVRKVALNLRSAKAAVGQSVRLKTTLLPANAANQAVGFASDKPEVASVSAKGVVKARSPGKAVITVTTQDKRRRAKFTIRVYPALQALQLNATDLTLEMGKRKTLRAKKLPEDALLNGNLVWKSNRPGVVSVSPKGVIKALSGGTAVITVSSPDGKVKARCTVRVGGVRVFNGAIKVTSPFQSGSRPDHNGLDIVGMEDGRVYATVGGRVRYARQVPPGVMGRTWEWGNFVWIEGDDGYNHIYAHMRNTPRVKEGSRIEAGTQLGYMGNTGYSFGVHTHYEVRLPNNQPVNPAPFTGLPNRVGIY